MRATEEEQSDALSRWLAGDGLRSLDGILGSALDIVGVIDRQLAVRYLNYTVPGLQREALIGSSALDLAPPDFREVARTKYQEVLRTGRGTRFDIFYKGGEQILQFDVRVGPVRFEGEVVGLVAITSDVTEQRRAQVDRDRFFSLSLDMLIVVSADGRLTRLNPALGQTLGYEIAELIGMPFIDLVHPDDVARTTEAFAQVLAGTPVADFENRYRRRDGEHRVFSWRSTVDPVTGDVYAVARDITEQRATESQLRHAQKMEAVGQLAGGIAHDFNNLLLAIMANASLAQEFVGVAPGLLEHLTEIEGAGQRAADLTKQLLTFSRRRPLRLAIVDLNSSIRGLTKMLRRLLPESIGIDFIPGHNLASLHVDPSQLEQVVVNLCVNARDAMAQGGQLTIETENVLMNGRYLELHPWAKPGRYVLLSVTDTGTGMTAEVRERAFEPFFSTKHLQGGTGLGLSTVYGIVQQHEGMVYIYSELGTGTTIKIYLPADARLATDIDNKIEALPPRGNETILVVEDEEQVRRAVVQMLQRAGYRTIAVKNGVEAVQAVRSRSEPIHLALMDVVMPEQGGPETWHQLRSICPGLRVIFISGYADDRGGERLPGDVLILEKPFRAEDLLGRVRKELDDSPS